MPVDERISEVPAATAIAGADLIAVVQSGATKKAAASLLKETMAGLKSFFVPATAIRPSASGGCQAIDIAATSANHPDRAVLWFDKDAVEYAQFAVIMPKNWDEGTITARFAWVHKATTTNFGVKWGAQAVAVSDGDSIDAAYGTAQEVGDTGGATDVHYVSAATSAITIAGTPQAEDMVHFRVYRLATDGADTLAVDAGLEGVKIYYTTNTIDEA